MMKKYIDSLRKNHFINSVFILTGGTVISQLITIFVIPLVTRLYEVNQFAIQTTYLSVLSAIMIFSTLSFELAIPLPEKDNEAIDIVILSAFILIIVCTTLIFIYCIFGEQLFNILRINELKAFFPFMPIGLFCNGIYKILNYWNIRMENYKIISSTRITQNIGKSGVQVSFGILKFGSIGLLIGEIAGFAGGIYKMLRRLITEDLVRIRYHFSINNIKKAYNRYVKFPIYVSISRISDYISMQLPTMIFVFRFTQNDVGIYGMAVRILSIPMSFIGGAIAQVFFGKGSKIAGSNSQELRNVFSKTTKILFLFGIIPAIFIVIFGPEVFQFVLGSKWREAGLVARILIFSFLMQLIVAPLSDTANIMEKQDLQAYADICRSLMIIFSFVYSGIMKLTFYNTVLVYSVANGLSYIVYYLIYKRILAQTKIRSDRS